MQLPARYLYPSLLVLVSTNTHAHSGAGLIVIFLSPFIGVIAQVCFWVWCRAIRVLPLPDAINKLTAQICAVASILILFATLWVSLGAVQPFTRFNHLAPSFSMKLLFFVVAVVHVMIFKKFVAEAQEHVEWLSNINANTLIKRIAIVALVLTAYGVITTNIEQSSYLPSEPCCEN